MHSLKGLAWKTCREWWPVVALLVIGPTVLTAAAHAVDTHSWQYLLLTTTTPLWFIVILIVFASQLAEGNSASEAFTQSHLPVDPLARWVVSLVLPLTAVTLAGAWLGVVVGTVEINSDALAFPVAALVGFLTIYVLSEMISRWLGMLGVIPVLFVALASFPWGASTVTWLEAMRPLLAICAGLLVGSFLFNVAARKWPTVRRQGFCILVTVLTALLLSGVSFEGLFDKPSYFQSYRDAQMITSADRVLQCSAEQGSRPPFTSSLVFHNNTDNVTRSLNLPGAAAPVAFIGSDRVVVMTQEEHSEVARVLIWHVPSDGVDQIAEIPAPGELFLRSQYQAPLGFARPDGRKVLIRLRSRAGDEDDLWVVDLRRGRATVTIPNTRFAFDWVRWVGKTAYLTGSKGIPYEVDTENNTARRLVFTAKAGGEGR